MIYTNELPQYHSRTRKIGRFAESILKVCRFHVQSPLACTAGVSGADLKKRIEAIMNGRTTLRMNAAQKLLLALAAAGIAVPVLCGVLTVSVTSAQTSPAAAVPTQAEIAQRGDEQSRPRTAVPFDPKKFDRYVGYYELSATMFFHIFRNQDRYFLQLTGQPSVEVYPESETKFFATVVAAQISFVIDARKQVTALVLHQNGYERPAKRIDESVVKQVEAALNRRIENNAPSPGTEASLRRYIDALEKGQPNYGEMSPMLAAAVRQQLPTIRQIIQKVGAFQSLTFKGVGRDGLDVYDATFTHGQLEWRIAPLSADGKAESRGFRELP